MSCLTYNLRLLDLFQYLVEFKSTSTSEIMQRLIQDSPLLGKLKHWRQAVSFSDIQLTTSQKVRILIQFNKLNFKWVQ